MNLKYCTPFLLLLLGCSAAQAASQSARDAGRELDAVLHLMPNPMHGEELFHTCAQCHGARDSHLPEGWVPQIAGQHVRVIAKQLIDYRHGRRWDQRMEIIAGRHVLASEQDIADVASYVAALRQTPPLTSGSGEHQEQGRALYQAHCADCHGRGGEGSNARLVPRLAGQDYEYLLRQLHDALEARRPSLGATHRHRLEHLDRADLEGLADYLSKLKPAAVQAMLLP